MKKSTFFTGLLTLMFSTSAIAQDLTIEAADFIIEESGRLDKLTGCIQNTGESTRICLGEVDFVENGDKYAAAGIVFASGRPGPRRQNKADRPNAAIGVPAPQQRR